jgi:hypothetical protein
MVTAKPEQAKSARTPTAAKGLESKTACPSAYSLRLDIRAKQLLNHPRDI